MDAAGLAGNGVDSTGRDGSDPADGAQSDTPGPGGRADPVGSGAGQMGAEELGGAALDGGEPGELAPADSGHCGMSVSAAVLETARSDGPHTDAPGPEGPANPAGSGGGQTGAEDGGAALDGGEAAELAPADISHCGMSASAGVPGTAEADGPHTDAPGPEGSANPAAAGGGQAGAAGAGGVSGGVPAYCGREAWPAWEGVAGTGPAGGLLVSRSDSADGHCQAGGRLGCRWL